jgi:peroxiredoxin
VYTRLVHVTVTLALLATGGAPESVPTTLPLRTLDGATTTLAPYAHQVVLLDIWATWCDPCRESLPAYDELYRSLAPRGLAVVAVSVDEHDSDVTKFLREHPVGVTVLRDPEATLAEAMHLRTMPTSFVVGRDGTVRARHEGFRRGDKERLRSELERLLAAEPAPGP